MSHFQFAAFPKLGLFITRIFGTGVTIRLYCVWACLRCAWHSVIVNNYWRSALWFKPYDEYDKTATTPYYSYPAIAYIKRLDWSGKHICELGGGYSTAWWAKRAARVTTLDENINWINRDNMPNVTGVKVRLLWDYVSLMPTDADVYIVDQASDRSAALRHLIQQDLRGKIVILDNAEFYEQLADELTKKSAHWVSLEGYAAGQVKDITTIWWF
jgi:hypothetical protein